MKHIIVQDVPPVYEVYGLEHINGKLSARGANRHCCTRKNVQKKPWFSWPIKLVGRWQKLNRTVPQRALILNLDCLI